MYARIGLWAVLALALSLGAASVWATGTLSGAAGASGSSVTVTSGTVDTVTSLTQMNGAAIAMNTGVRSAGTQRVTIATDDTVQVAQVPATSGGASIFHLISAATTNATNVKASAGQLYGWSISNTNAATLYVKLHNTAGTPTAGASVVYVIAIPGGGVSNIDLATGLAFGTGIGISTVTGVTDASAVAVAVNDLNINLHYK